MATYSASITASTDDAAENSGTVDLTSNALSANTTNHWIGLRFLNATIPPGSTITAASLDVELTSGSFDDPDLTIYGHDTDDATTFTTTTNDISGRTQTTAATTWTASSLGTGVTTSPSITTIIQEIIDRPGWSSGNDIAILINGRTSSSAFRIRSQDAGSGTPATLNVTYTPPAGGGGQPTRTLHQFRQRTT